MHSSWRSDAADDPAGMSVDVACASTYASLLPFSARHSRPAARSAAAAVADDVARRPCLNDDGPIAHSSEPCVVEPHLSVLWLGRTPIDVARTVKPVLSASNVCMSVRLPVTTRP